MRAQLVSTISQSHCCVICSHHTMTPKGTADRGKQRGEKKQKTLQGYPQVSAKAIVHACVNRGTYVEQGLGTMTVKPHTQSNESYK